MEGRGEGGREEGEDLCAYVVLGDRGDEIPDGEDGEWDVNGSHQVCSIVVRVKVTCRAGAEGGREGGREGGMKEKREREKALRKHKFNR